MRAKLSNLENLEELEQSLNESSERPVLLFKHSLTCPISFRAFREFESYLDNADPRISYKLITVQTAREISREVADRLGIKHESPQAILVSNGRGVWNASHLEITQETLSRALAEHA
jgi:bacillithiol system protein YtxJ